VLLPSGVVSCFLVGVASFFSQQCLHVGERHISTKYPTTTVCSSESEPTNQREEIYLDVPEVRIGLIVDC